MVKPETEEKKSETLDRPKPNGVDKAVIAEQKAFEEAKKRLEGARNSKETLSKEEREKKNARDIFKNEDFISGFPPDGKSKKPDNYVETPEKQEDKKEISEKVKKAEKEALESLKKKYEVEIEEELRNFNYKTIDQETRKSLHTQILAKQVSVDTLPVTIKEQALRNIKGPDGKPIDVTKPLTEELKEVIQRNYTKRCIEVFNTIDKEIIKDPEKFKAELEKLEKQNPGITKFADQQKVALLTTDSYFENPESVDGVIDIVKENGLIGSDVGLDSTLGKKYSSILQKNIGQYLEISKPSEGLVDVETFIGLKDVLGSGYKDLLYSGDQFPLGADHPMKKARDTVLQNFKDESTQDEIDPTPDGIAKYQKKIQDNFSKSTGLDGAKEIKNITKLTQSGKVSFLVRLIANILAPFGAMFDGEVGEFWRKYMKENSEKNTAEREKEEAQYGESGSKPFEGKGVENASSSSIYGAASKYLGKNESNSPAEIRAMHKSAGLNAGAATPWCMSFVQHVLRKDMGFNSAQIGPPSAAAAAGHKIGQHTDSPKQGDIVLIYRKGGSGRHIGFVNSVNADGSVNVLGGNQSDSVNITRYPKHKVAEYRTLESAIPSTAIGGGLENPLQNKEYDNKDVEKAETIEKKISYQESLILINSNSTPKYDEKGRLIIYKVDTSSYARGKEYEEKYQSNTKRGDPDKKFIAVHGTAADFEGSGKIDDNTMDKSALHEMLNSGLYPYFISKKGVVFSTTEDDKNHPACINDVANDIVGIPRLNNKGIAIEMSLRADGKGSVEPPNEVQRKSGKDLILALRKKYDIGAGNIITSKDPVRDPVTGEFKGKHGDDFDDTVRKDMGIAQYSETAKRFREKKFFTDDLAKNNGKNRIAEIATGESSIGSYIYSMEARKDSEGRLTIYKLPKRDKGGTYEVAGINNKFHSVQAAKLANMIQAGKHNEAEQEAKRYIEQYVQGQNRVKSSNKGVDFAILDTTFHRGGRGSASVASYVLGEGFGGNWTSEKQQKWNKLVQSDPEGVIAKIREAREEYEKYEFGQREEFWAGFKKRWNETASIAKSMA